MCKVNTKHILSAFRFIADVAKFELSLNVEYSKLRFIFHAPNDIKRTYSFNFEESPDSHDADFGQHNDCSVFICRPNLFSKTLHHFSNRLTELSFQIDKDQITALSYTSEEDGTAGLHTEALLQRE
eukprot:UN29900